MLEAIGDIPEDMKIVVTALSWCRAMDCQRRCEALYPGRKNIEYMCLECVFLKNSNWDYIIVDEIFALPVTFLYILYQLPAIKYGAGDHNQMVFDLFSDEGDLFDQYQEVISAMFPTRIMLTEIHRFDQKMQEVLKDPGCPSYNLVQRVTLKDSIDPSFIHITLSNRKRHEILKAYRERGFDTLPDAPYMARKRDDRLGIFNGTVCKYKDIAARDLDKFELAYAITNTKAQGSEYDTKVVIHEWDGMLFHDGTGPKRILYTALGRAKSYDRMFLAVN
jgi:hypothetical protein